MIDALIRDFYLTFYFETRSIGFDRNQRLLMMHWLIICK